MPGHDGTGPLGEGPMTGKGRGYCVMELPVNGELPGIVSELLSEVRETGSPDLSRDDTTQLFIMINRIKIALMALERRVELLINNRRQ
jgi:hypothetical protein